MLCRVRDSGEHNLIDRNYLPHRKQFENWTGKLSPVEIKNIERELNRRIDEKMKRGEDILTSSWVPGSDWTGTPFQPIYEKACGKSVELAALCFGLFLWKVMSSREEYWSFGRFALNNVPIRGLTYFQVHPE